MRDQRGLREQVGALAGREIAPLRRRERHDLADHHAAGDRRRRRIDRDLAGGDGERGLELRQRVGEIGGAERRLRARRARDIELRRLAAVHVEAAVATQQRDEVREILLHQPVALAERTKGGAQRLGGARIARRLADALREISRRLAEDAEGDRVLRQGRPAERDVLCQRARGLDAEAREALGRGQDLLPAQPPVLCVQGEHAARIARRGGDAAPARRAGLEVDDLRTVELAVIGKAYAAAAQGGDRRQGHGRREIGRDRGVGGAAAAQQDVAPDERRARFVGDHGTLQRARFRARAAAVAAAATGERECGEGQSSEAGHRHSHPCTTRWVATGHGTMHRLTGLAVGTICGQQWSA
jgi:hypothetical protein